ncbi:MAG: DUF3592 domain-containing protein [Chloroflexi bacterium]|nr:DUF3592 domain-containing protein [Chloroflexota bacterium]
MGPGRGRRWTVDIDGVTHTVEVPAPMLGPRVVRYDGETVRRDDPSGLEATLWRLRTTVEYRFGTRGHRFSVRVRPTFRGLAISLAVDGIDVDVGRAATPPIRPPWTGAGAAQPRLLVPPTGAPAPRPHATVADGFRRAALFVALLSLAGSIVAAGQVLDNVRFEAGSVRVLADVLEKQRDGSRHQIVYQYRTHVGSYRAVAALSQSFWEQVRFPSRIGLRYLAAEPPHHRIDGEADEWLGTKLAFTFAVWALAGAVLLTMLGRRRAAHVARALTHGIPVDAVVLGFDRLDRRGSDGGWLWSVRYAYRDGSLGRHEGTSDALLESAAARYAPGDRVTVKYLPAHPSASAFVG